jgi:hypothetical protein
MGERVAVVVVAVVVVAVVVVAVVHGRRRWCTGGCGGGAHGTEVARRGAHIVDGSLRPVPSVSGHVLRVLEEGLELKVLGARARGVALALRRRVRVASRRRDEARVAGRVVGGLGGPLEVFVR